LASLVNSSPPSLLVCVVVARLSGRPVRVSTSSLEKIRRELCRKVNPSRLSSERSSRSMNLRAMPADSRKRTGLNARSRPSGSERSWNWLSTRKEPYGSTQAPKVRRRMVSKSIRSVDFSGWSHDRSSPAPFCWWVWP